MATKEREFRRIWKIERGGYRDIGIERETKCRFGIK